MSHNVRDSSFLPYGRQCIDSDVVAAVVETLKSDYLTTGPKGAAFEKAFADKTGARYAVAVNSGTAALHAAMAALKIGPRDEVIVPPITFAATANCVVFQGGVPVFADVLPDSLLIDPKLVERKISKRTKAIIAVDYAGCPCDYDTLKLVADKHGLALVADACHALGAMYKGRPVGSLTDLNCFSFHPVKHITTGEGGMITTDNPALAQRMRDFRTHGMTRDPERFTQVSGLRFQVSHYYEMQFLGYNYRMPDINAALGLSQLQKLDWFIERRHKIALKYHKAFASLSPIVCPLSSDTQVSGFRFQVSYPFTHAYHLYVVRIDCSRIGKKRSAVVQSLEKRGIGTQMHYIPVHLHPFYREHFGTGPGMCPVAEAVYESLLSLPMYASLTDADTDRVIEAVREAAT